MTASMSVLARACQAAATRFDQRPLERASVEVRAELAASEDFARANLDPAWPAWRAVQELERVGYIVTGVQAELALCESCGCELRNQHEHPRVICETCHIAGQGDPTCRALALARIGEAQGWRP